MICIKKKVNRSIFTTKGSCVDSHSSSPIEWSADQENGRVDEFRDKRSENQPRGTKCDPRSAVM